jgi:hypothetical protein
VGESCFPLSNKFVSVGVSDLNGVSYFLYADNDAPAMIASRIEVAAEIRQNWQKAPITAPCR